MQTGPSTSLVQTFATPRRDRSLRQARPRQVRLRDKRGMSGLLENNDAVILVCMRVYKHLHVGVCVRAYVCAFCSPV